MARTYDQFCKEADKELKELIDAAIVKYANQSKGLKSKGMVFSDNRDALAMFMLEELIQHHEIKDYIPENVAAKNISKAYHEMSVTYGIKVTDADIADTISLFPNTWEDRVMMPPSGIPGKSVRLHSYRAKDMIEYLVEACPYCRGALAATEIEVKHFSISKRLKPAIHPIYPIFRQVNDGLLRNLGEFGFYGSFTKRERIESLSNSKSNKSIKVNRKIKNINDLDISGIISIGKPVQTRIRSLSDNLISLKDTSFTDISIMISRIQNGEMTTSEKKGFWLLMKNQLNYTEISAKFETDLSSIEDIISDLEKTIRVLRDEVSKELTNDLDTIRSLSELPEIVNSPFDTMDNKTKRDSLDQRRLSIIGSMNTLLFQLQTYYLTLENYIKLHGVLGTVHNEVLPKLLNELVLHNNRKLDKEATGMLNDLRTLIKSADVSHIQQEVALKLEGKTIDDLSTFDQYLGQVVTPDLALSDCLAREARK